MRAKPASLEQIQRWMQSVLVHPGGVDEGVESAQAGEHLLVSLDELESVIRRSKALSARERLEIYVDAYHERLMECLREEFPATRHALGDELFDALAFGYLERYPSRSYTLGQLGACLPRFLSETRLHAHEAPRDAGPTWTDFVIDLATFERTLREVFDSPGTEGRPPLDVSRLAQFGAEELGRLRLTLVPNLRLETFGHDVYQYWRACKDGAEPSVPHPRTIKLAICRHEYIVAAHEVSASQLGLLRRLQDGTPLLDAIAAVTDSSADEPPLGGDKLSGWFSQWARLGFFAELAISPTDVAP